ncbi:MAG: hypothetical protein JW746_05030 [Candidatus Krumholzibacteriota bacterium]|nr:hypothetical protein [Candidatus Krumholzibacteriota bacterium]
MAKKIIFSGLSGGLVLIILTFVINGLFGFRAGIDMKQIPNERLVYETLKDNILEPGRYICNPEGSPSAGFPRGEPVFSVMYGGVGHEAAGKNMIVGLVIFFLAPIIASWMLSTASERIISSYPRKVLFFAGIGLLFAVFGDLSNFGIGSYPLRDAFILAAHSIFIWTLAGLAAAWQIKPEKAEVKDVE